MRWKPHVRFGGRAEETGWLKGQHRASVRSNHTHGTLLIAAGVPVKVVSERLGHATPTFTIETYQHVLPGMQADAARVFEQLVVPGVLPATGAPVEAREKRRKTTA
jgi:integrase